ncbi:MAG: DUF4197 domain-containing protein [Oceanococcus sp.]
MNYKSCAITLLPCLLIATQAQAGWRDWMRQATEVLQQNPQAAQGLNQTQIVAGLREALAKGSRNAILQLGQTDGFLENAGTKIQLPEPLGSVAPNLRKIGLGQPLDELSLRINRAAESAVPEAADIFSAAIEKLSIEDAMNILNGPDDAATRYFESKTSASLAERFRPLIAQATDQAGVSAAYKQVSSQAGPFLALLSPGAQDLDSYVTDQALKGLFTVLAEEEKKIRLDPAARTTDLLKQVFGNKP